MFQSSYTVDAGFRFRAFGGGWATEAERNGQPGLLPERLTGQPMFDHIAGAPTEAFLRAVLLATRGSGRPAHLPYRCDTTSHGRLFDMEIIPESSGGLTVRHHLRQVRPYPASPACRPEQGGAVCSICCRVEIAGHWRETGLAPVPETFARDCTVCPYCLAEAHRRLPNLALEGCLAGV